VTRVFFYKTREKKMTRENGMTYEEKNKMQKRRVGRFCVKLRVA